MTNSERKKRDLAEREQKILRMARERFQEQGYLGLNMDDLAQDVEYSKGTLYQHFESKEDLLLALAVQALGERAAACTAASDLGSTARQKIVACLWADQEFLAEYPCHDQLCQLVSQNSLWQKSSKERQEQYRQEYDRRMEWLATLMAEAMANGEIQVSAEKAVQLVYGIFALSSGASLLAQSPDPDDCERDSNAWQALQISLDALLDGAGLMPLSHEYDYGDFCQSLFQKLMA